MIPSSNDVIFIHDQLISRYGGSLGIRDLGLLESALMRPVSGYYSDAIQEAAALWESLSQNHPFVDGNKRTAFAVMSLYLESSGFDLLVTNEDAIEFVTGLYESGAFRFENLEAWIRRNAAPLE